MSVHHSENRCHEKQFLRVSHNSLPYCFMEQGQRRGASQMKEDAKDTISVSYRWEMDDFKFQQTLDMPQQ